VKWLKEQYRLARQPGFLEAKLATVRAQVGLWGQRQLVPDRLPSLRVPTLVVWGERDRVLPHAQAREAISRIPDGSLELIPDCEHLPQVERSDHLAELLTGFLKGRSLI
jgi:pimeloyl-ACP methyl ester carboxylesterase